MTRPSELLVQNEPGFRSVIEGLREGVAVLDTDDLAIHYANPALLRLLGRDLAEVRGLPLVDLVDANDVERTLELARTAAAGRVEVELRAKDGTIVPVALSVTRVEDDYGSWLALSIFNLTGQHELMRRERERLERIGRRKDEFIAMLGHELRNPLAPLRHVAELLRAPDLGTSGPTLAELTDVVHRQVDHMARLVADLLDIGRTTSGRLPVRPQRTRLADVVLAAVESVAPQLARRGHTLRRDCPDLEQLELDGDTVRLTQMLTNLLSNAIKYTPDGGVIDLIVRTDGRWLSIVVKDDGIGIAADELDAVFEPFYQAGASLDRALGGLGIGLSLVRGIVELHGGIVTASSDGSGRGSAFEVRLPGVRRSDAPPPPAVAEPLSTALSVLVIDDNEDAARMLAMLLERRGCHVDVCFLGGDGLAMAQREKYDLAFVDIGLPDLDGYSLAGKIAGSDGCPRHLVALTGYGQAEDRARALAAGFHEHVVKPLSPKRLDELLATAAQPD
jgi:PAS domain S-box-containing protein